MSENSGKLALKIAKIIGALGNVPKNGRNSFHKYDYVMEADLTRALAPLLSEHNVAFFPSVVEVTETPGKGSKQQDTLATVTLEITIVDGESGDTMVVRWRGQGMDSGDKAYYKAYTGAIKYFLMKTFLVDTGDDPEIDQDAAPTRAPSKQAAPQQAGKFSPAQQAAAVAQQVAALPLDDWESLMRGAGLEDLKAASAACAAGFKKGSVRDLDPDDLAKVNRKLAGMAADQRREYVQDKIAGLEGKAA